MRSSFISKLPFGHAPLMIIPPNQPGPRKRRTLEKVKIAKKKAKEAKSKTPVDSPVSDAPNQAPNEKFAAAKELLRELIKAPEVQKQFDPELRTCTQMVYTKGVTLWMLILQRLGNGLSLEQTVSQVINSDRDIFPDNKRVREGTLSENSSAYQNARKRMPLKDIHRFSSAVCHYLGRLGEPVFGTQRVFILDGTTITLQPTEQLKRAFPPAPNQHGTSVWPVARLMVATEMRSGCAMLPQIDPMYGPENKSEARQAKRIVRRLPENSIVMADANFGIFSVAHHSLQAGHDVLFRLTRSRFKSYHRKATLIDQGLGYKSYQFIWEPSANDRKTNPDIPADTALDLVLHEIELENGTSLYLVTSLGTDALGAAELYLRRYDIEFDIRDMKVTMDAENIQAKSVVMVLKELFTSIVAYNLIAQFRRQAAKLAGVAPRRLSFTGVWTSFRDRLLLKEPATFQEWQKLYLAALISASNRKLPNRSKPRSFPRIAHTRSQKRTKFMKVKAKNLVPEQKKANEEPPPLVEK